MIKTLAKEGNQTSVSLIKTNNPAISDCGLCVICRIQSNRVKQILRQTLENEVSTQVKAKKFTSYLT